MVYKFILVSQRWDLTMLERDFEVVYTVLEPVHGLDNTGHEIYVDNIYTGVDLFLEHHDRSFEGWALFETTVCKRHCCKERNVLRGCYQFRTTC